MITRETVTPLIIGDDMCQRFCFYGLRSLLYIYIRHQLGRSYQESMLVVHGFFALSYISSLLGAFIVNKSPDRARMIVFLGFIYFSGTLMLTYSSVIEDYETTIWGLLLIALGSGCLKTCIGLNFYGVEEKQYKASDQDLDEKGHGEKALGRGLDEKQYKTSDRDLDELLKPKNPDNSIKRQLIGNQQKCSSSTFSQLDELPSKARHKDEIPQVLHETQLDSQPSDGETKKYFLGFVVDQNLLQFTYFAVYSISLLSMIWATVFAQIKCLGRNSCYSLSFGFGSILLLTSLFLYYFCSESQSSEEIEIDSIREIMSPIWKNIKSLGFSRRGSRGEIGDKVETQHISRIFVPIVIFWVLFDQQVSKWIEQGNRMKTNILQDWSIVSREIPIINSLFVIIIISILFYLCLPWIRSIGRSVDPFSKISYGFICASLSFFISGLIEFVVLNSKNTISILWQIPQYIVMAVAEILFNNSAISFVCSGASKKSIGIILTVWLLSVAVGNIIIILISQIDLSLFLMVGEKTLAVSSHVIYGFLGLYGFILLRRFFDDERRLSSKNEDGILVSVSLT